MQACSRQVGAIELSRLCEVPGAPRTTTDAPLGRWQLSGVVGAALPWGVPLAGRSTVNMTHVCSTPDSALRHK